VRKTKRLEKWNDGRLGDWVNVRIGRNHKSQVQSPKKIQNPNFLLFQFLPLFYFDLEYCYIMIICFFHFTILKEI
jgi:hypothetical protein